MEVAWIALSYSRTGKTYWSPWSLPKQYQRKVIAAFVLSRQTLSWWWARPPQFFKFQLNHKIYKRTLDSAGTRLFLIISRLPIHDLRTRWVCGDPELTLDNPERRHIRDFQPLSMECRCSARIFYSGHDFKKGRLWKCMFYANSRHKSRSDGPSAVAEDLPTTAQRKPVWWSPSDRRLGETKIKNHDQIKFYSCMYGCYYCLSCPHSAPQLK